MNDALTKLRNLADPEITIDEAVAICKALAAEHPKLVLVAGRIDGLREERDLLHQIARNAMSDASWERSDMKKWADKQKRDPDND